MRKNFDMDAVITRALRESIEAHAHEWEPGFKTGVGPVGDDAPFDKKPCNGKSCGDMHEGTIPGDSREWEPGFKTGVGPVGDDSPFDKKPCHGKSCGDMDEGTIPGDSREWEPGFKTGVGPVGDDNPFTKAVNEAFVEGGDWEKNSFGAPNHRKEGIAFADGADECGNGILATSQKNSGEVISSDNLSESEDEEGNDESTVGQFLKNGWDGLKRRWNQAKEQDMAKKGWVRAGSTTGAGNGSGNGTGAGNGTGNGTGADTSGNGGSQPQSSTESAPKSPSAPEPQDNTKSPSAPEPQNATNGTTNTTQPEAGKVSVDAIKQYLLTPNKKGAYPISSRTPTFEKDVEAAVNDLNAPKEIGVPEVRQIFSSHNIILNKGFDAGLAGVINGQRFPERKNMEESQMISDDDVIVEERNRFFDIMNRIEKLYD